MPACVATVTATSTNSFHSFRSFRIEQQTFFMMVKMRTKEPKTTEWPTTVTNNNNTNNKMH